MNLFLRSKLLKYLIFALLILANLWVWGDILLSCNRVDGRGNWLRVASTVDTTESPSANIP